MDRVTQDGVMRLLAEMTGGKSYKAHKFALDGFERPSLDYGDSRLVWERWAETTLHRSYVDLTSICKTLARKDDQILTHFLDGSRRVFKVDDMAFQQAGGRTALSILAGQIGVVFVSVLTNG